MASGFGNDQGSAELLREQSLTDEPQVVHRRMRHLLPRHPPTPPAGNHDRWNRRYDRRENLHFASKDVDLRSAG